jgi:hypothetical protein
VAGSISLTVLLRLFGTYTRDGSRAHFGLVTPGEICAYTFTEGALAAGALPGGGTCATAAVGVPHRPTVAAAFRCGADVQALSSPDPQVTAANAVMARRRVRT